MTFPRMISGYTSAAEQRRFHEKGEMEARAKYDEARAKIIIIADEFRGIEDTIVNGIDSMDDSGYAMEYLTTRAKKLTELYVEVHRWKNVLKNQYKVDP